MKKKIESRDSLECLVSVVMPVYNGDKHLKESINSILNQTYTNIEFIIINDGSNDMSDEIIKEYIKIDTRIKYITNEGNKGLIYSLNKGLDVAKGKYIIRMDCDDIAFTDRIKKQVHFMESNNDIAVAGGAAIYFIDKKPFIKQKFIPPANSELIRCKLVFGSCINHPSTILRTSFLKERGLKYSTEYLHAEDYGLWSEISQVGNLSNIQDIVLNYRVSKTSVSKIANTKLVERKKVLTRIYNNMLEGLIDNITENDLDIHYEIARVGGLPNYKYTIEEKIVYLERLIELNQIKKVYDIKYFSDVCIEIIVTNIIYLSTKSQFDKLKKKYCISTFAFYKNRISCKIKSIL